MLRILLATAVVAAAMAFAQRPAQANDPPWCLISAAGDEHCRYNTLEECLRDRVGGGGFCNPNPRYHGAEQRRNVRPQPSRRRH